MKQNQPSTIEERFWLYWGISPEATPKYKAGKKALNFIHTELSALLNRVEEEVIGSKEEVEGQFSANSHRRKLARNRLKDLQCKKLLELRKEYENKN